MPAGYDGGLGPPVLSTDDHSLPLAPRVRSATDRTQRSAARLVAMRIAFTTVGNIFIMSTVNLLAGEIVQ